MDLSQSEQPSEQSQSSDDSSSESSELPQAEDPLVLDDDPCLYVGTGFERNDDARRALRADLADLGLDAEARPQPERSKTIEYLTRKLENASARAARAPGVLGLAPGMSNESRPCLTSRVR